VRDRAQIAPALLRARESVHRLGRSAVINSMGGPARVRAGNE
jgi:hypothetical protein